MIVFSIMLFIIGFFVGKNIEEGQKQAAIKEKQEQQKKEEGQYSYSHSEKNPKVNHDEHSNEAHHEHYITDNPEEDKVDLPTNQTLTLQALFPQKDLAESKKVAEAFVRYYYPFNGDNPLENVEKSKIHMSKALYNTLKGQMVRPTQTIYKKQLTKLEVYEPYNPTDQYITWNVRVIGNVFNSKGELNKKETNDYSLKLIKEDGVFKVDKFTLNVAY